MREERRWGRSGHSAAGRVPLGAGGLVLCLPGDAGAAHGSRREFGNAETRKEENEDEKHSPSHCPEKPRVNVSEHFLALKTLCVGERKILF